MIIVDFMELVNLAAGLSEKSRQTDSRVQTRPSALQNESWHGLFSLEGQTGKPCFSLSKECVNVPVGLFGVSVETPPMFS